MTIIILIVISLIGAGMIMLYSKSRKPYRSMLVNGGLGIVALSGVAVSGLVSGMAINFFTVGVSIILGIPGVIGMTILGII